MTYQCVVVVCDRDHPIYENFYPFRSQVCFLVSVFMGFFFFFFVRRLYSKNVGLKGREK